jgi:RNase P/RNase MRP subunit p29
VESDKGGQLMEELIGQNVRISFDCHSGMVSTSGKVTKVSDKFIVVVTSFGPLYIMLDFVKTINVIGSVNEEK